MRLTRLICTCKYLIDRLPPKFIKIKFNSYYGGAYISWVTSNHQIKVWQNCAFFINFILLLKINVAKKLSFVLWYLMTFCDERARQTLLKHSCVKMVKPFCFAGWLCTRAWLIQRAWNTFNVCKICDDDIFRDSTIYKTECIVCLTLAF